MYNQPRKATIEASSDCQLWSLERKVFSQTAQYYKTQQNQKLMDVLSRASHSAATRRRIYVCKETAPTEAVVEA